MDRAVVENNLNVNLTFKPIRQEWRILMVERRETTREEVEKLLKVGYIREVCFPR